MAFIYIKYSKIAYSSILITADFLTELQAEKYPSAPFERLVFGFAGAAEPGLLFTSS